MKKKKIFFYEFFSIYQLSIKQILFVSPELYPYPRKRIDILYASSYRAWGHISCFIIYVHVLPITLSQIYTYLYVIGRYPSINKEITFNYNSQKTYSCFCLDAKKIGRHAGLGLYLANPTRLYNFRLVCLWLMSNQPFCNKDK